MAVFMSSFDNTSCTAAKVPAEDPSQDHMRADSLRVCKTQSGSCSGGTGALADAWNKAHDQLKNQPLKLCPDGTYTTVFGDDLSTVAARALKTQGKEMNGQSIKCEEDAIIKANSERYSTLATKTDCLGTGWHLKIPGLPAQGEKKDCDRPAPTQPPKDGDQHHCPPKHKDRPPVASAPPQQYDSGQPYPNQQRQGFDPGMAFALGMGIPLAIGGISRIFGGDRDDYYRPNYYGGGNYFGGPTYYGRPEYGHHQHFGNFGNIGNIGNFGNFAHMGGRAPFQGGYQPGREWHEHHHRY
jgi:hypothetical protein